MKIRMFFSVMATLLCAVFPVTALVVNNTEDSGAGSLRQAIMDAMDGGIITFDNSLSGQTIVLTNGQFSVTNSLTIDASGLADGLILDGNAGGRIFEFISGTNILENLTLTNGSAFGEYPADYGGAIFLHASAQLTLNNITISSSTAVYGGGGIYNELGTLTLNHCKLFDNTGNSGGGGVENYNGTLIVNHSTFSGNRSGTAGGGIANHGTLTLNNSTLSGNSAAYAGGGLYSYGTDMLNNSTLAENVATFGGGIYSEYSLLELSNTTVSANSATNTGGGIYNDGTFNSINSITAGNTASSSPDLFGGLTSGSNNLTNGMPMLAPLGDYGGSTQTMHPLPGSPAIDMGINTAGLPVTDQRGFSRTAGMNVDIGAVEAGYPVPGANYTVVTTTNDFLNGLGFGGISLRDAVAFAPNNSIITFSSGLSGQTILLTGGQLTVSNNLSIDASYLGKGIIIDGNANGRIFEFAEGTTSMIDYVTLTNGLASGGYPDFHGGAIMVNPRAFLTVNRSTISSCTAVSGGGIYIFGTLILNDSTVVGNSASYGGGIYNAFGTLTVNNSTHSGNWAIIGGGINNDGLLTLNHCTLSDNTADSSSGGLHTRDSLYSTNSIVAGNTAPTNPNIDPSMLSGSNNLISGDPQLAPLGDYGGANHTMPPLPGSPAIDAGGSTSPLSTDQRGLPRVAGSAVDIGSVEIQIIIASEPPVLTTPSISGEGTVHFSFTNLTGASFTVYSSTNVALPFETWTNLGPAAETPPGSGQFEFVDSGATNDVARFYRVVSP